MGAMTGRARVVRVNGPLVQVEGLAGIAMLDAVELGPQRLPGEVVAIRGDLATVQAYEYTGGLAPGTTAVSRGDRCPRRSAPTCSVGCSTGCSARSPALAPGSPLTAGTRKTVSCGASRRP